jgi:hypothetical protein
LRPDLDVTPRDLAAHQRQRVDDPQHGSGEERPEPWSHLAISAGLNLGLDQLLGGGAAHVLASQARLDAGFGTQDSA